MAPEIIPSTRRKSPNLAFPPSFESFQALCNPEIWYFQLCQRAKLNFAGQSDDSGGGPSKRTGPIIRWSSKALLPLTELIPVTLIKQRKARFPTLALIHRNDLHQPCITWRLPLLSFRHDRSSRAFNEIGPAKGRLVLPLSTINVSLSFIFNGYLSSGLSGGILCTALRLESIFKRLDSFPPFFLSFQGWNLLDCMGEQYEVNCNNYNNKYK